MTALLRLADVRVDVQRAGEVIPILRGVSFDVAAGETVGLVGESGSGKTMSARAIMRLLPHGARTSGQMTFAGQDVASLDERHLRSYRRQDVAMVFQDPLAAINPVRRIGDFLTELERDGSRAERHAARERALRMLADVDITDPERVFGMFPHQLSGGMLQRCMIAAAIMHRPKLIIADEPTTALDVTTQSGVVALLDEVRREHDISMVFISHDVELVAAVCDRIVVMRAGEIVETLAANQLHSDTHRQPYTNALLSCRPDLAERKPRLSTLADFGLDGEPTVTHRPAGRLAEGGGATTAVLVKTETSSRVAAVEVSGLTKTFGGPGLLGGHGRGVTAVKDVSFELRQGSTLAVVGESGSGKTTLARMIMGLEVPSDGSISFFGARRPRRPSMADLRKQARQVQLVFQNPYRSLDPRQAIGASLDEVLRLHFDLDRGQRAARTEELLATVHLDPAVASALPSRLSGGQRQRACIARALAAAPQVLVLDEAVSALDVSVQAQVLNVLADIRDETGVSYLFVTHDLAVVRQIADDVIVMRFGEIVERGPAGEVLDSPQHEYTRRLLDSVPREGWKPGRR